MRDFVLETMDLAPKLMESVLKVLKNCAKIDGFCEGSTPVAAKVAAVAHISVVWITLELKHRPSRS